MSLRLGPAALAMTALAACKPTATDPVTVRVAAAISLKEPMTELARTFEASHPSARVELSLGASGDLANQIERGAPIDLFASAAESPALKLVEAGRATPSCTLATNALVLVRRDDPSLASLDWQNLAQTPALAHLALGLSPSVPAGTYAEDVLGRLGELDALRPKLVRGANVRQVLELVARGEADAGVVYASDVLGRTDVVVVGEPPERARPKIVYPLVVSPDASSAAKEFATMLCGEDARRVLVAHGLRAP